MSEQQVQTLRDIREIRHRLAAQFDVVVDEDLLDDIHLGLSANSRDARKAPEEWVNSEVISRDAQASGL